MFHKGRAAACPNDRVESSKKSTKNAVRIHSEIGAMPSVKKNPDLAPNTSKFKGKRKTHSEMNSGYYSDSDRADVNRSVGRSSRKKKQRKKTPSSCGTDSQTSLPEKDVDTEADSIKTDSSRFNESSNMDSFVEIDSSSSGEDGKEKKPRNIFARVDIIEKKTYYRSNLRNALRDISYVPFKPVHIEELKRTPFWMLLSTLFEFGYNKIKKRFTKDEGDMHTILKRFDTLTETFMLGSTKIQISRKDVKLIFGIADGNIKLPLKQTVKKFPEWVERCFGVKKKSSKSQFYLYRKYIFSRLDDDVLSDDPVAIKDVARLVHCYLLACLFAPTKNGSVSMHLAHYVQDLDIIRNYDWSDLIWRYFIEQVKSSPNIIAGGCAMILPFWLCEHTNLIKPRHGMNFPRFMKWDLNVLHSKLKMIDLEKLDPEQISCLKIKKTTRERDTIKQLFIDNLERTDPPGNEEVIGNVEVVKDTLEGNTENTDGPMYFNEEAILYGAVRLGDDSQVVKESADLDTTPIQVDPRRKLQSSIHGDFGFSSPTRDNNIGSGFGCSIADFPNLSTSPTFKAYLAESSKKQSIFDTQEMALLKDENKELLLRIDVCRKVLAKRNHDIEESTREIMHMKKDLEVCRKEHDPQVYLKLKEFESWKDELIDSLLQKEAEVQSIKTKMFEFNELYLGELSSKTAECEKFEFQLETVKKSLLDEKKKHEEEKNNLVAELRRDPAEFVELSKKTAECESFKLQLETVKKSFLDEKMKHEEEKNKLVVELKRLSAVVGEVSKRTHECDNYKVQLEAIQKSSLDENTKHEAEKMKLVDELSRASAVFGELSKKNNECENYKVQLEAIKKSSFVEKMKHEDEKKKLVVELSRVSAELHSITNVTASQVCETEEALNVCETVEKLAKSEEQVKNLVNANKELKDKADKIVKKLVEENKDLKDTINTWDTIDNPFKSAATADEKTPEKKKTKHKVEIDQSSLVKRLKGRTKREKRNDKYGQNNGSGCAELKTECIDLESKQQDIDAYNNMIKKTPVPAFRWDMKCVAVKSTNNETKVVLMDLWDAALERQERGEMPDQGVQVKDLLSLLHHDMVSNVVIDAWSDLLISSFGTNGVTRPVLVFTAYTWELITDVKSYSQRSLDKLLNEKIEKVDQEHLLLFPLLTKSDGKSARSNGNHWTLLSFDLVNCEWSLQNSMAPRTKNTVDVHIERAAVVVSYVENILRKVLKKTNPKHKIFLKKVGKVVSKAGPQQVSSSVDCGVVVCYNIEQLVRNQVGFVPRFTEEIAGGYRAKMVKWFLDHSSIDS